MKDTILARVSYEADRIITYEYKGELDVSIRSKAITADDFGDFVRQSAGAVLTAAQLWQIPIYLQALVEIRDASGDNSNLRSEQFHAYGQAVSNLIFEAAHKTGLHIGLVVVVHEDRAGETLQSLSFLF